MRPVRATSRRRAAPRQGAPRFRRVCIPGAAVEVRYDDFDPAPGWQERRLQRHLARLFPDARGVSLVVDVAWLDADDAWELRRAAERAGREVATPGPVSGTGSERPACPSCRVNVRSGTARAAPQRVALARWPAALSAGGSRPAEAGW